ncbi:MAG: prephenate dehydrogenase/arogenate dehydrogenase family protein [Deltaproteobacteria bacterium]|nr:prephenate dehydrogenase/arogenate dehydrogenase family protein [Deltaproteobacteria bacterium]MBW2129819.1 prephenate dehydrogenase/arogenate dehydrogenase family protein [Deltaproteobacteria bacterium]MBW2304900.1 prephenate dehydrogenase/arogenate dehydrogenase family protein [Deltaproteobacteria bacterium]
MGLERPVVGIVGGTGRMGTWFADLLEGHGLHVVRTGRSTKTTPRQMASLCDVVVISVPVAETTKVIRDIGPLVKEDGLLMDLTSVKKGPVEAMLNHSRAQVVGVHPLFGPETGSAPDMKIAICPARGQEGLEWISAVFRNSGYGVICLEAEVHDRMMGVIQGVTHFSSLVLALFIHSSDFEIDDLVSCSTPTFKHRLDRIRSILDQPPGLFSSLMMDNPYAGASIEKYLDSCEHLIRIIRARNRSAFDELFESLEHFFSKEVFRP